MIFRLSTKVSVPAEDDVVPDVGYCCTQGGVSLNKACKYQFAAPLCQRNTTRLIVTAEEKIIPNTALFSGFELLGWDPSLLT